MVEPRVNQPDVRDKEPSTIVAVHVQNLDCEHDAAALRNALASVPGVSIAQIYPRSGKLRVQLDPSKVSRHELEEKLSAVGFPVTGDEDEDGASTPVWQNRKVIASVASGALLLAGWLLSHARPESLGVRGFYSVSLLAGALYFGREALNDLFREHRVGIELLMTVAAVVSFALGHPSEAAMLAFLYSISEAAEGYTEARTRGAIRALMKLVPKIATVRRDGREVEVPAEDLVPGDVFVVRPGGAIPTDGTVVAGASSVDQAPVTGESTPVEKGLGDSVFAGSLNGQGGLEVRATTTFAQNTLNRIIHLVEEAQEERGRSHRFIEKFSTTYSPIVLALGVALALVGPLVTSGDFSVWIVRATVFIVSAAPCALAISVPVTFVAALGKAARNGILIKGGVHLEDLARVTAVAFDKTGTLTMGRPEVTDVVPIAEDRQPDRILALAAAVESWSEHPLARAIVAKARGTGTSVPEALDFQSTAGLGAEATVQGTKVRVASAKAFATAQGFQTAVAAAGPLSADGKTVVFIGEEARVIGVIGLRDNLRPGTKETIRVLRSIGIQRIIMLSGDSAPTARAIAAAADIDEYRGELTPDAKVTAIRELLDKYAGVAMVGDGVNDAPALAVATVGIAMGAAGSDVALEAANVALMADDLGRLPDAFRIARRARTLVRQNLLLSALVIIVLVGSALLGAFGLPLAVLAHEISEFIVIGNGLRILKG